MAYHLSQKKTVKAGIVKIAKSQIDKAIEEVDEGIDRHEVVHQVRKRCKKLRGLIRLIRPVFPDYAKENVFFRDAASELSYVRDSQSVIESFEDLVLYYDDRAEGVSFETIRRQLVERRDEIADDAAELEEKLKIFRVRMVEARARVKKWKISEEGFDALAGGFMKTYKRGRKAFSKAYENPSTESFHEWRKRVKYHWYHCRLLRQIWPEMLKVHRRGADDLSDYLGDEHDLAVLKETLEKESHRFDGEDLERIYTLIGERRSELQHQAQLPGERLYAEKKTHIARRFGAYWMSWRR